LNANKPVVAKSFRTFACESLFGFNSHLGNTKDLKTESTSSFAKVLSNISLSYAEDKGTFSGLYIRKNNTLTQSWRYKISA